jgi:hypothetical protein
MNPMTIVNLADESITDLSNAVIVPQHVVEALDDEVDVIHYAEAHGLSLANLVAFAEKVAAFSTMDEIVAALDDPNDPDQILEAEQETKHYCPDQMDELVIKARDLLGRN